MYNYQQTYKQQNPPYTGLFGSGLFITFSHNLYSVWQIASVSEGFKNAVFSVFLNIFYKCKPHFEIYKLGAP